MGWGTLILTVHESFFYEFILFRWSAVEAELNVLTLQMTGNLAPEIPISFLLR